MNYRLAYLNANKYYPNKYWMEPRYLLFSVYLNFILVKYKVKILIKIYRAKHNNSQPFISSIDRTPIKTASAE